MDKQLLDNVYTNNYINEIMLFIEGLYNEEQIKIMKLIPNVIGSC